MIFGIQMFLFFYHVDFFFFFANATNIPVNIRQGFVVQGHIWSVNFSKVRTLVLCCLKMYMSTSVLFCSKKKKKALHDNIVMLNWEEKSSVVLENKTKCISLNLTLRYAALVD